MTFVFLACVRFREMLTFGDEGFFETGDVNECYKSRRFAVAVATRYS